MVLLKLLGFVDVMAAAIQIGLIIPGVSLLCNALLIIKGGLFALSYKSLTSIIDCALGLINFLVAFGITEPNIISLIFAVFVGFKGLVSLFS